MSIENLNPHFLIANAFGIMDDSFEIDDGYVKQLSKNKYLLLAEIDNVDGLMNYVYVEFKLKKGDIDSVKYLRTEVVDVFCEIDFHDWIINFGIMRISN